MRALLTRPGGTGGLRLAEIEEPVPAPGEVVVRTLEVGVCGTDRALVDHGIGAAPAGSDELVLGHEVVGEIVAGGEVWPAGTLVTATVRRPCGECPSCAAGQVDACDSGGYRERGIFGLHGFASERFAEAPENLFAVPPGLGRSALLAEPASVCEKAVRQAFAIGSRHPWTPGRALVVGAGAIGVLTTIILRLRGLEVVCAALQPEESRQAEVIAGAGGRYRSVRDVPLRAVVAEAGPPDLIVEASGSGTSVATSVGLLAHKGVLALIGADHADQPAPLDAVALSADFVSHNKAFFGTVNAGAADWLQALDDLAAAGARWPGLLDRIVGARLPPERARDAFAFPGIKAAIQFVA